MASTLVEDDVTWFDKDLDDFELPSSNTEEDGTEVAEEDTKVKESKRRSARRGIKRLEDGGMIYPLDLWFILSHYIPPENVGIFAGICRMTYYVTNTVQFWRQLYFRCCDNLEKLPEDLKPVCLERVHGLRQRVIRALYHAYPPFVLRTASTAQPFEDEHHSLIGLRCLVMWYEPVRNLWLFNFKLRKERISDINRLVTIKSTNKDKNLHTGYCDLYSNAENDCFLLQVTCQNFQNVTSAMGLVLSNVTLKVGHGMRYHCLKLHFDSCMKTTSNHIKSKISDVTISLDPVLNLKVFPWWHPKYPVGS
ncbi:hypothetical protein FSP39_018730 [Pinctada imbricata]|uniref:Transmembrane protein 183 n=1 Tax=Pinctada imbricata TaxID=66713 RepID=A0AA89C0F3_PINIB|nr:hypothetical protein FSP39_018730 [Pinctada imbricata]